MKNKKMKAYMACSRTDYNDFLEGGATLIFAHTVKEAKRVAWQGTAREIVDDYYLDLAIFWLRGKDFLFANSDPQKIANNEAHEIDNPRSCGVCGRWAHRLVLKIGKDDLCDECRTEVKNDNTKT